MIIRKAERRKAKLRLGISGASGSGKTWSALEIATGIGGKIGLIDTESGRAELYGNDFDYDVIRLDAPYSPDRYMSAIGAFEEAGYDTIIIDSMSHAWSGEGGVLSIVERAGGNTFSNGWKTATPKQNSLIDKIINCKSHVIVTLRVKTEYVVEKDDRGKSIPKKVGLSPVQRDNLEYEFMMFMNMSQDHLAHVSKDNTKLYDQEYIKPSKDMGKKLLEWLNEGKELEARPNDDFYLDKLSKADTLVALKSVFDEAYRSSNNKEIIVAAKDKRKLELQEIKFDDIIQ